MLIESHRVVSCELINYIMITNKQRDNAYSFECMPNFTITNTKFMFEFPYRIALQMVSHENVPISPKQK